MQNTAFVHQKNKCAKVPAYTSSTARRTLVILYAIVNALAIGHKNKTLSSFTEVWKRHRGGFVF